MYQSTVEDVALFFDFENISISLRKQGGQKPNFKKIMAWFSQFGRIVLAKAYADWATHYTFLAPLQSNDFDPVFVTTYSGNGQGAVKNACDMQIAVDATAVSFNRPHISTYGLLTGDKDYLPLVNHLRSMGKRVIVLAVAESASIFLKKAVDLFVPYREMLAQVDGRTLPAGPQIDPAFELLVQALEQLKTEGKEPVLARVKSQMDKMIPGGFDPKAHKRANGTNYGRFLSFLKEAERQGLVQLMKKENDTIVKLVNKGDGKSLGSSSAIPAWPTGGMPLN